MTYCWGVPTFMKGKEPSGHAVSVNAAWPVLVNPVDLPVRSPSDAGTPLSYGNIYNRALRPALIDAGIAKIKTDEGDKWDYQGVAFHAFRKACGSLLLAHGKDLKQVQGWLRHAQLSTTLNVYIHKSTADSEAATYGKTSAPNGATLGPPNTHQQPQTETGQNPRNPPRDPKPQTATTP